MGATVATLVATAEAYLEDSFGYGEAVLVINNALDWLGEMAYLYGSDDIESTASMELLDLPADCVMVEQVRGSTNVPLTFVVLGNQIAINYIGTATVYYRRMPAHVTTDQQATETHQLFDSAFVSKLCAWFKYRQDEEDPDAARLEQEWQAGAARAFQSLRRKRGPTTVAVER